MNSPLPLNNHGAIYPNGAFFFAWLICLLGVACQPAAQQPATPPPLVKRLPLQAVLVSTLAGADEADFKDGSPQEARFSYPWSLAAPTQDTLYIADRFNHRIRLFGAGRVSTLAGQRHPGWRDGAAAEALFSAPLAVILDTSGMLYIADTANHRLRKATAEGAVTTLAGTTAVDGNGGYRDGAAPESQFNSPSALAFSLDQALLIADTNNHSLRRLDAGGQVSTLAGRPEQGFRDGPAEQARFFSPRGVAADQEGNVYVADTLNHRLRKIAPDGTVSTLAGTGQAGFADGPGGQARFNEPLGLVFDQAAETLYLADSGNHRIRSIALDGTVSTLAGNGQPRHQDGEGQQASLKTPSGLAFDPAGDLYVADSGNHRIRKLTRR